MLPETNALQLRGVGASNSNTSVEFETQGARGNMHGVTIVGSCEIVVPLVSVDPDNTDLAEWQNPLFLLRLGKSVRFGSRGRNLGFNHGEQTWAHSRK